MERRGLGPRAAVLCLTLAACGEPTALPDLSRLRAEAAVERWVAENPDGYLAEGVSAAPATRPSWTPSCSSPDSKGTVSLRIATAGGALEFSFACPVSERSTTRELEYQLIGVTPYNLTPGIRADDWEFQALLPLGTIRTGASFSLVRPGVLAVHVRSTMRGIVASRSPACGDPLGAVAPVVGRCVFVRPHAIPLDLHFTLPADLSALR